MAFCANCGAQIEDGANFCPACGQTVNAAPAAPAPEYPAAPAPEYPAAPAPEYQAAPAPEYQAPQAPQYQAPPQQPAYTQPVNNFTSTVQNFTNTADTTSEYDPAEIQSGKGMSVLAYLGILCLIPMFAAKANRYVQFHVKQGFTLMLCGVALAIVDILAGLIFSRTVSYYWITYRTYTWPYYIFAVICWVGFILVGVLSIIGIVNACQNKAKELPITGKIKILK